MSEMMVRGDANARKHFLGEIAQQALRQGAWSVQTNADHT